MSSGTKGQFSPDGTTDKEVEGTVKENWTNSGRAYQEGGGRVCQKPALI
jgi:hypothetical protein